MSYLMSKQSIMWRNLEIFWKSGKIRNKSGKNSETGKNQEELSLVIFNNWTIQYVKKYGQNNWKLKTLEGESTQKKKSNF